MKRYISLIFMVYSGLANSAFNISNVEVGKSLCSDLYEYQTSQNITFHYSGKKTLPFYSVKQMNIEKALVPGGAMSYMTVYCSDNDTVLSVDATVTDQLFKVKNSNLERVSAKGTSKKDFLGYTVKYSLPDSVITMVETRKGLKRIRVDKDVTTYDTILYIKESSSLDSVKGD